MVRAVWRPDRKKKNTKGVTDVVPTRTRPCPFSPHAHINLYMFSA